MGISPASEAGNAAHPGDGADRGQGNAPIHAGGRAKASNNRNKRKSERPSQSPQSPEQITLPRPAANCFRSVTSNSDETVLHTTSVLLLKYSNISIFQHFRVLSHVNVASMVHKGLDCDMAELLPLDIDHMC